MVHINLEDAQAWTERTKLTLGTLELELEAQVAAQVLTKIAYALDVSSWTDSTTTPEVVRSIIAMHYVGWLYHKTYSEDEQTPNAYANRLLAMAGALIDSIIEGTTIIPEVPVPSVPLTSPLFYPTDLSSALEPTSEDPSLGGARFTLGAIF